jgi:hypothetical protein
MTPAAIFPATATVPPELRFVQFSAVQDAHSLAFIGLDAHGQLWLWRSLSYVNYQEAFTGWRRIEQRPAPSTTVEVAP